MTDNPSMPLDVAAAFDAMPAALRPRYFELRKRIFEVADRDTRIGQLTETLKWGAPAYRPAQPRTGSTIRLGPSRTDPDACAIFFICTTRLVDTFRERYPELTCDGDRAILLKPTQSIPPALDQCISAALTYHLDRTRA